jgi:hypothetical protein
MVSRATGEGATVWQSCTAWPILGKEKLFSSIEVTSPNVSTRTATDVAKFDKNRIERRDTAQKGDWRDR